MLSIYLPTIRSIICPKGIYKVNETSSKAGWVLPNNISGQSVDHASRQSPVTADYLTELSTTRMSGLLVNHKKSLLEPTQSLEFLGFEMHTKSMTLSIPQEKMRKIQQDARRVMGKTSVSVRELAQFVGKATATVRAILTAPLYYTALQFLMNSVFPEDQVQEGMTSKFNTVVQLDPMSKADLSWWISLDRKFLSTPIVLPVPSVTMESDEDWGAVLNGQSQTGAFGQCKNRNIISTTVVSLKIQHLYLFGTRDLTVT